MKNTIAIVLFALLTLSCQVNMHTSNIQVPESAQPVLVIPRYEPDFKNVAVNIKNAEQVGDILILDVSYSGGCADHDFELVSNGRYESTYPPELEVKLWHNGNGDRCRSVIDERIYFDLKPYQYGGTTQVRLRILNNDRVLDYSY